MAADLDDLLAVLARRFKGATVNLYWGVVPRICEPADEAPDLQEAVELHFAGELRKRRARGGPRRNAYLAALVAYMRDIEARPLIGQGLARTYASDVAIGESELERFGLHEFLAASRDGRVIELRDVTGVILDPSEARSSIRSRTVDYWRAEGRRVLAAHGAWPWAVVPEGRLPRSWRCDSRFVDALASWCLEAASRRDSRLRVAALPR